MKRLGMVALLGMLTIPGISKAASVCQDQACVDKAFIAFQVSVFKANGAYLNSVNKVLAIAVQGDESKAEATYYAAFDKFAASLEKATVKFEATTGLEISGETISATVYEANATSFVFVTGEIGYFGY